MRRAPAAAEGASRTDRMATPFHLAGLCFSVWALVFQFALPLATALSHQLSPDTQARPYDIVATLTGRLESGHGKAGGGHSLPIRVDANAILVKAETPGLHDAAAPFAARMDWYSPPGWQTDPRDAWFSASVDYAHLSRAPPSFGRSHFNA